MKEDNYRTAAEIGKKINLDRTTVQKAIKKLITEELAERIQVNLKERGYTFKYKIANKEEIKKRLFSIIRSWTSAAEKHIKKL